MAGGWWRSNRIEAEIANVRAQQADLYRDAFPGARVSGAILKQVRSEHMRVANSRGRNLDVEIPPSSTMILREILAALPSDVRYRVQNIDIVKGVVSLVVLVKSSRDASIITNAIEARGFKVPSPNVRRNVDDDRQWEAPIIATWVGRTTTPEVSG